MKGNNPNKMIEEIDDIFRNMISVLNSGKKDEEFKRNDKYQNEYFEHSKKF